MTAIRLSPTVNRDELFSGNDNIVSDSIFYRVPGVTKAGIPLVGGVFGLPTKNVTEHPDYPGAGLIARNIIARDYGNGIDAMVEVVFATPNASGRGLVNLEDGTFAWSMSREIIEVPIPVQYAVRDTFTSKDVSGDPTTKTVFYFEPRTKTIRERRTVIQARWELNNPNGATIQAFANQDGKVHELNGSFYLFQVGTLQPKIANPGTTTRTGIFVGSWIHDPGTRNINSSDTERLVFPADTVSAFGQPYIGVPKPTNLTRAPWHYLELADTPAAGGPGSNQGSPIDPFTIVHLEEYEFDINGYQTLPGIPSSFPTGVL
jgi:hypothetical protein